MTMTDQAPVIVEREVWKPPRRAYVIVAALLVALVLVVTAPMVALVVHQVRINQTASITSENSDAISRLTKVEKDLRAQIDKERADRAEAHYENCLNLLSMWTIDDAVILFETSPGSERSTLLGFLPAQPHCVKPA